MQRVLRKLCLMPLLLLVLAAVTGLPGTAAASSRESCQVEHRGDAGEHLDVVGALAQHPAGGLAHQGEAVGEEGIQ